jgi:NDP-sugar pyrophosphorylase family protein
MRCIILAAGKGERFLPLTEKLAKPALPFLNRPLIHYSLEIALRAGVREIGVNLHHLPATIEAALAAWDGPKLEFFFSREKKLMGTGGALAGFIDWSGKEEVLLLNSDTLMDFDPAVLAQALKAQSAEAAMLVRPNPDPYKFATVIVADGRVLQIAGLPRTQVPNGQTRMFTGAHLLAAGFIRHNAAHEICDINRDIYPRILGAGERIAAGEMTQPVWADLGSQDRYLAATHSALKLLAEEKWPFGRAARSRLIKNPSGALLYADDSVSLKNLNYPVEGFAVIGAGALLLTDCHIRNSVLLPGARIGRGATVSNAIIGPKAYVPAGATVQDKIFMAEG